MANSATASARAAEPVPHSPPDCDALCALFDALFLESENTRLVKGGEEPVYLPADAGCAEHRVVFRLDYVPSALHEIAHFKAPNHGDKFKALLDRSMPGWKRIREQLNEGPLPTI